MGRWFKSVPKEKTRDREEKLKALLNELAKLPQVKILKICDASDVVTTVKGQVFCRPRDFLLVIAVDPDSGLAANLIYFGHDYTSHVVFGWNDMRKWDFDSDWREGVAQVIWGIRDQISSKELWAELEKDARKLQEESERLGY